MITSLFPETIWRILILQIRKVGGFLDVYKYFIYKLVIINIDILNKYINNVTNMSPPPPQEKDLRH